MDEERDDAVDEWNERTAISKMERDDDGDQRIQPTDYDLVLLGTGLGQAMVAAAAAKNGKQVLHLDREKEYGGHWRSLTAKGLHKWAQRVQERHSRPNEGNGDVQAKEWDVYSDVEIAGDELELTDREDKDYCIDLAAPKLAYCAGELVQTLIDSGTCKYVEFKPLEGSYLWTTSKFTRIPASRSEVFRDKNMPLIHKRMLMKYLQDAMAEHDLQSSVERGDRDKKMLVDQLKERGMPEELQDLLMYGVALLTTDERSIPSTSVQDAMLRIKQYVASVGKFGQGQGAFLLAYYGNGDLPQAFCRTAAVKGATYILSEAVSELLFEENEQTQKQCIGVRLDTGQVLGCKQLVVSSATFSEEPSNGQVISRGVCILDGSILPEESQALFIFPPNSVPEHESRAARALQVGSSCQVCPRGKYLLYLAIENTVEERSARSDLEPFVQLLSEGSFNTTESHDHQRPTVLYAAYYKENVPDTRSSILPAGNVASVSPPDATIDFGTVIQEARASFQKLYPDSQFFVPDAADIIALDDDIEGLVLEQVMEDVHAHRDGE